MAKLLKPGTVENLKTRSNVRRFEVAVLTAFLFSILACSRSITISSGVQATQWAAQLTAVVPQEDIHQGSAANSDPQPTIGNSTPPLESIDSIPTASPTSGDAFPTASNLPALNPTSKPQLPTEQASPTLITPNTIPTSKSTQMPVIYYTQAGDTLHAIAVRFNVKPDEITSPVAIPSEGLFSPGQLLLIPNKLGETGDSGKLLPDSEIVFSPAAIDFDVKTFVKNAGGYLATYQEWLTTGWKSGAEVIQQVAIENSVNPRLLLALIEYQGHWVYGQPTNLAETDYPLGYKDYSNHGLYRQLSWAVSQLSVGYYGWRAGLVTELDFPQGKVRIAPDLNAGTVALQYLFSRLYLTRREWGGALYAPDSIPTLYERMFGNPWLRAQTVEPLYPPNLTQPTLELPFPQGQTWSMTGGPHSAWGPDGALAAIDFAPSSTEHGCVTSDKWVTASAAGLVVRSENGVVILDLDGDGHEQTGWVLLYLHIATDGRVPAGAWVAKDDKIGHPSCEGGVATGTHVHIARKFNGEWILADGPVPFVLSGWQVHAGEQPYKGTLTKDDQVVIADIYGTYQTRITR